MIEDLFISLIIIFSALFTAMLWRDALLLTISLILVAAFTFWHFHKKNDFITFILAGSTGVFGEAFCIYFGAWSYTNPTYLVPLWLPFLWGLAGLVIRRITLEMETSSKKRKR